MVSPKDDGFTLIELLVVLTIMGLIAVILPPLLARASGGAEAKMSAMAIARELQAFRGQSIAQGHETDFILDIENKTYRNATTESMAAFPKQVEMEFQGGQSTAENGIVRIRFFSDGSSTGGRIKVFTQSQVYRISVDWLTGKVSVDG